MSVDYEQIYNILKEVASGKTIHTETVLLYVISKYVNFVKAQCRESEIIGMVELREACSNVAKALLIAIDAAIRTSLFNALQRDIRNELVNDLVEILKSVIEEGVIDRNGNALCRVLKPFAHRETILTPGAVVPLSVSDAIKYTLSGLVNPVSIS